jgi:hypothetical protein
MEQPRPRLLATILGYGQPDAGRHMDVSIVSSMLPKTLGERDSTPRE